MKTSTTYFAPDGNKQIRTFGAVKIQAPHFVSLLLRRFKQSASLIAISLLLMFGLIQQGNGQANASYTVPGTYTFTVPAGVFSLDIQLWGGGGAGGAATGNPAAGGGGAGGSYVRNTTVSVTPGQGYTVTVGAGGAGSTTAVNAGGDTWFGSATTLIAKGGPAGAIAGSNNSTAAGAGALTTGNIGYIDPYNYYGGAGGTGAANGASGGGGGGSAGTASNGNNATGVTGGTLVTGGGAGVNGSTSSANGADNTNLGGGGAGGRASSSTDRRGGNGGPGAVYISYPCSTYGLSSATTATSVCGSGSSTVTINSDAANLPNGTYTVTYDLSGANTAPGLINNSMAVTSGIGTFTIPAASIANFGLTTLTITNLALGACNNAVNINNTASINVNPTPATPGTPTSDGPKCTGTNVTLTANGTAPDGEIWYWQTSASGTSTANSGSTFTVTTAGTTYIRSQNTTSLCWSAAASVAVTFNALPTNRTVGGTATICSGSSQNITVQNSTNSTTTYQLRDNLNNPIGTPVTGTGSTINLPTGPLTNTTVFNVLATITATGCTLQMTNTPTVTVNPAPAATGGGGNQAICVNGTATVSGITATNGSISWAISNGGGTISNGTTSSPTYTPIAADAGKAVLLTMTVANSGCTSATATYTVNVEGLPTATAGGSQTICYNGTATVSGTSASNGIISWATSNGVGAIGNPTSLTPTYTAVDADAGKEIILTMTVTSNNACAPLTATATYTVNVGAVPVPTIICAGGSGTLTSTISCLSGGTFTFGPKNAGAGATGGGSNLVWTTPENIVTDDANVATSALGSLLSGASTSQNLNATGFGFSIPSNATINGISVAVNRWASGTGVTDVTISLLKAGSVIGNNKASSTAWTTTNTTIINYGNSADLWGTTWTPGEINASNFGLALSATNGTLLSSRTASVNYIQISVNYTTPDGILHWYTSSSGGAPVHTGATFNPVNDPLVLASGAPYSNLVNTNTPGTYTFYSECSTNPVCRTATDFVIKVMPETPVAGNNGPICVGEALTLTASSTTNATYSWTGPNGFASAEQNPTVSTSATTDMAGIYKVKATIDGCTSAEGTTTVIVNFFPTQPDAIEGSATPCSGTSQIYSVTNVPSVSYNWVFPAGWTPTGPTNLNSITVLTGTVSGEISVTPSTPCGSGPAQTLAVNLTSGLPPDQPGPISGPGTPCEGSSQTYSVDNVDGVNYIWTFPSGWNQTAGDHTNSVIVTVGNGSGPIQVTPANNCSIGTAQTFSVTPVLIPLQPGPISGLTSPNQGFSQVYSVPFVSSGITYDWVFPTGWTPTAGQTSNSVTVTVGSASGTITVTPHSCTSGPEQTLSVSPIQGSSDATITPLTSSICLGSSVNLSGSSTIPISPVTITTGTDNFNGTSTYASAGSNTGGGIVWTKEPSGFNVTLVTTWTPPDASSFMLTYAAAIGTATTNSTLTSPVINTTNFSAPLSLSFQHTYQAGASGFGKVEVSTDGGATWLAPPAATYTTNQGTSAAFATVSLNLNAYINQPNLKIRFNYSSTVTFASSWWGIDNVTLSGAPLPLFSWIASPSSTSGLPVGAGTPSISNAHISVNPTLTTNYIVTATNPLTNATVNSGAATVTVNPVPAQPSITPGGPTTFCAGGKVTLTSSPEAGYLWSPGGATTQSIDVTASGNYTVQVTNSSGCPSVSSNAVNVTVNPLPVATISAGGPTTFCQGGSVVLTSSLGSSYSWSTGETTSSITVNSSGSYTVKVTDAAGCFATSVPTVVTVNALPAQPTITAEGPTTFCIGGSVTLTANAASSYAWSPGGGISQSITVTTPGDYTVQVTNAAGCLSVPSAATTVTVNSLPDAPAIVAGGPLEFCFGGKVTLTSTSGSGYLWSNGALTQSIDATESGSYTVRVTDANGCQSNSSLAAVVTVNPLPTAVAWTDTPSLCEGFPFYLHASGGTSYSWTGPNSFTANGPDPSIDAVELASDGDYIVTVTDGNTCSKTATVHLTVIAQPAFKVSSDSPVCEATDLHLTSSGGDIYSWTGPGITLLNSGLPNPTIPNVTLGDAGTYTVTITNNLCGQSELSTTVDVIAMPVAPTAANNTVTYDGLPHTATATVSENNVVIDWYANSSGPTTASEPTGTNANTYIAYAEARNTVTKCINPFRTQVTLIIGKRPITITVNPGQTKSCKENDPLPFTYSVSGDNLAPGDVFYGLLERVSGEEVNSYAINQGTLTILRGSDDNLFNYQLTFNPGVFTITDIIPPVITAPKNIDQGTDQGICEATVLITPAKVEDNCGVGPAIGTRSDGRSLNDKYPIGPTTITWSVTDFNGNIGESKDQIVTISDNEKPVIHVSNINQPADGGSCEAKITIVATATDNCGVGDPSGIRSDGLALNDPYPVGITTITWSVTDIHNNLSTLNQTITVADDVKPTVYAHPFTLNLDQFGHATLKPTDIDDGSFDYCGIVKFGLSQTNFDCSNVGANDVFLFASDKSLNSGVAMTTVTVKDEIAPVITCPANISVNNDATKCGAIVTFAATATDNCSAVVTYIPNSGTLFQVGTTTVKATATDPSGNKAECSFTVTVTDNEPPVITTDGDKNVSADLNLCGAAVVVSATANDNCSVGTPTGVRSDALALDALYPVGITSIKWNVNDANGNPAAEVTQTVTVTDDQKPVITTNGNQSVNTDVDACGATVVVSATATDNCTVGLPTGVRGDGLALNALYPVGTTTILWDVKDVNGNPADQVTQTVTVTDNISPVITCPANISVNNDATKCGAIVTFAATATDNCSAVVTYVPNSGTLFQVGTTTVKATATDPSGNKAECSFTVTVTDNEPPVITTDGDKNVSADLNLCGAAVVVSATANDNCSVGTPTGVRSDALALDALYPVGITSIKWNVNDANGNPAAEVTQTVTVTDDQKPVITTNGNQSVNTDVDACGATVVVSATATDNCTVGLPTGVRGDGLALNALYPVGTTTILWDVKDVNGNPADQVTQTVTVTDNISPVITCPANISVNNDATKCGAIVTFAATATDNCSAVVTYVPNSGTLFQVGTTTVKATATDPSGNKAECSFTVTVTDNEPPVITTDGDKNVSADLNLCGAAVVVSATANDNCSVGTPTGVRSDALALDALYPVGITSIKWNVNDANGNPAAEVTQTVTVTDDQKPVITTNGNQSVNTDVDACGATVVVSATATDNCTVGLPTGVRGDGLALNALYPVGTTTILWDVKDVNGNPADQVTQTVTVTDNISPVITCPANISVNNDATKCGAIVTFAATATDNCSAVVTYVPNSGTLFQVGTTTVKATATDPSGNKAECSFTVTVTDNEPPVITTDGDKNVSADLNLCGAAVVVSATANDNCSVGTPTGVRSDALALDALYPVGITSIKWNVNDANGNPAAEVTQTVTVTDDQKPVITTNGNQSVNTDVDACGATVVVSATATDNCTVGLPTGVRGDGLALNALYPVGTTTILWDVKDVNGNPADQVTQTVTVTDNISPVITCPANITKTADQGVCGTIVDFAAIATDNCSAVVTYSVNPGTWFQGGITTVTATATDPSGNKSDCSFTVTITDNEPPVITTNGNKSVSADLNVCGATVVVSAAAGDNCSVGMPIGVRSDGLALNALYPVGTTTINWNVTDESGNPAVEVIQTVIVTDDQKPVIATNGDKNVNNDVDVCGATVVVSATATDNCTVGLPTGVRSDGLALDALYHVGTTTILWNVKDVNGNPADQVTQTVTVKDNQKPVITCPANISVNNDATKCGAIVTFAATATDNCSAIITYSQNSGTLFQVGPTTVTATATDPSGNTAVCSFTVTVKDNESPVITTNGDKNVSTDLNVCGATVPVSATASDNCSVPTPTGIRNDNLALNALYPVGITTIKWNVNDGNGNAAAEVTQTVTVTDNQKPTVITQNVTVALDGTGHATVTAAQINNGSNDACGIISMSLSKTDFTSADVVNPNIVTLSVTDNNGNVGTGTATVTVTAIQINVVALPQTKVYGDPDPELKYTFTPALLGNDSFTGTLSRAAGNSVNTYAINQGTLALPGYYKINFTKADLTITPRPVTVRADAQSKQWGTSDPTLTYQITSGTLVYNESCEGSLTRDPGEDVGVYQIRQGTLHLSSNYTLKYEGNTFTITQKSMLPSVTVSPATIQYSDEVTFTARITLGAPLLSGRLHPSASVTFKIGAQDMGTVQLRVKGLDLEGKLTTTLSERIKGQMAPGNKVVYAVFSFSDRKMTVSPNPATSNLMITQEDARVTVTGTYIQSTNSFGKSFDDGKVLLKATIQDITACRGEQDYDPNAGDIRNARVRFMKGTTPITNWLIPDLVNGRDTKTGVVNAKWSFDGASRDVPNDIRVEVGGDGYYVRNNPSDLSVVTLYSPTGDYVAGGGYLSNPNNCDGSFHGTPGLRTNFGFVVKYTNKGTNPQGNMDFIFRRLIDGQVHTYQINSTSITYVAVNDVFRCGKNALITAKANLNEITNPGAPLLMGSNLKLLVRMSDYGDNASGDRIAISLWNGFSLLFSSNWNGLLTTQTLLGDGNLIIHSGFNFGDIFKGQADDGQEHLLTSEIGVKAYPNPFTDHVYFDLSLPTDSKVRLEIYNVDGSKVATLYDDVVVAYDHYRLEFAPNKLSSNILIYRLIVDGKLEFTGKLIHK